ncbi:MAG: hypothetical protein CMC15_17505 [Flavobacteriaceae bacterium]|nr:hypothetical protein [Flavobacteriaceae bacterium]|tara:strand:- start:680 stop:898 length:219 start_codon:yes stop_codon:yes gene_type:complete
MRKISKGTKRAIEAGATFTPTRKRAYKPKQRVSWSGYDIGKKPKEAEHLKNQPWCMNDFSKDQNGRAINFSE